MTDSTNGTNKSNRLQINTGFTIEAEEVDLFDLSPTQQTNKANYSHPTNKNKPPKTKIIEFAEQTQTNPHYEFTFYGDETQAKNYIHSMRNELSRLRTKARERGLKPIQFKVITHHVDYNHKTNECVIKLSRKYPEGTDPELDRAFSVLAPE